MKNLKDFKKQWERTNQKIQDGYTLAAIHHPLRVHIGYDNNLNKNLRIFSKYKTKIIESSSSVEVKQIQQDDKQWILNITLINEPESWVFISMCHDLLDCSKNANNEFEAFRLLEKRYNQWKNLFNPKKEKILTDKEQIGLIGELLFLRHQIIDIHRPIEEAVAGWLGTLGEHQDFVYNEKWYEIKTTSISPAIKITISSLEQLSRPDSGELVVYQLSKVSGIESQNFNINNFNLNQLVREVSILVDSNISGKLKFYEYLKNINYSETDDYDNVSYKLLEVNHYDINDTFPRLKKENLPKAIEIASYSLHLNEIEKWKLD